MDVRINTTDDPFTSDKNLMNFDTVMPEFCRLICTRRTTLTAWSHISSVFHKRESLKMIEADFFTTGCQLCYQKSNVKALKGCLKCVSSNLAESPTNLMLI